MNLKGSGLMMILLLTLAIMLESCSDSGHERDIRETLAASNREVIKIEEKSLFSDKPFTWNTKEMRFYKFTYNENGEIKEGWVRFKVFGEDWIMDYK